MEIVNWERCSWWYETHNSHCSTSFELPLAWAEGSVPLSQLGKLPRRLTVALHNYIRANRPTQQALFHTKIIQLDLERAL